MTLLVQKGLRLWLNVYRIKAKTAVCFETGMTSRNVESFVKTTNSVGKKIIIKLLRAYLRYELKTPRKSIDIVSLMRTPSATNGIKTVRLKLRYRYGKLSIRLLSSEIGKKDERGAREKC